MSVARVAITPGEPAGVGPDLAVRIAQQAWPCQLVAFADPELLAARAAELGAALELQTIDYDAAPTRHQPGRLWVDPLACRTAPRAGVLEVANADYVLTALNRAVDCCQVGACAGLVTGPVHKAIINRAGVSFSGHTDYIAARCGAPPPVMMLVTADGTFRVALASVHRPLAEVSGSLTVAGLDHVFHTTAAGLSTRFGIARPRLLVAGLNPHAGEGGYLGREEIEIIQPAIEAGQGAGLSIEGPLPADTLFVDAQRTTGDVVIAMYHDQGLPVVKYAGFGRVVNVSLGLPIVRTSVDHGTALALAGTGDADASSLAAAIATALTMIAHGDGA